MAAPGFRISQTFWHKSPTRPRMKLFSPDSFFGVLCFTIQDDTSGKSYPGSESSRLIKEGFVTIDIANTPTAQDSWPRNQAIRHALRPRNHTATTFIVIDMPILQRH